MEEDKRIPELPEGFTEWADSKMKPAPIYYQIKGNRAMCTCGKCAMTFEVRWSNGAGDIFEEAARRWDKKPVRFEAAKCKICDHEGAYEWKRVVNPRSEYASYWIMQRTTENDAIVRIFSFVKTVQQGTKQKLIQTEEERVILKTGAPERYRNVSVYGNGKWNKRWEARKEERPTWQYCDGKYPTWDDEIAQSNQKYFCPLELSPLTSRAWDDTNYLIACCNNPAIEMYAKAGMEKLVEFLAGQCGKSKYVNRRKKKPEEQLKIRKERIKDLIREHGNMDALMVYQMEKRLNCRFTEEQIEFIYGFGAFIDKIERTLKFISITQLMNRTQIYYEQLKKQDNVVFKHTALIEYTDYLYMRQQLGYDMTNTVFLFPRNLEKAHAQMVKEQNARKDEMHIVKKTQEFPIAEGLIKRLNQKYSFETEQYSIRPAQSVAEIIMEGRTLHHCVGGDNYLRKHTKGKSTICFLRTDPEAPYITIEVNDTKIVQWYGKYDKKPNREVVEEWLKDWLIEVEKRNKKSVLQEAM